MSAPPGPNPQQPAATGAPAPAPAPTPQTQTPAQGLPPTGIDQQLATVNATAAGATANMQMAGGGGAQPPQGQPAGATPGGSTSIQQLARNLAQQYQLPIGRGNLVDENGNFLQTPDQLAKAGGAEGGYGGLGEAMSSTAAKMNFISSAIANQQNREQQTKARAAISTGLGQVQERGRGSLASLQTGLYQDLADLYANEEYEAADFSYFIQQGMINEAQTRAHRSRKSARKTARIQAIGSAVGGVAKIAGGFL